MLAFGALAAIKGRGEDGALATFCLATWSALESLVRNGTTVWPCGRACVNGLRRAGRALPAGAMAFCGVRGVADDGVDDAGIDVGAAWTVAGLAITSPVASAAARRHDDDLAKRRKRCAPNEYPLTQRRFAPTPRPLARTIGGS